MREKEINTTIEQTVNFDVDIFFKNLNSQVPIENIEVFKSIDSTNSYAKKLAEEQTRKVSLIITDTQTAGRGRNKRVFFSPNTGLYFSLLFYPKLKIDELQYITIMAAVAVVEAIHELGGQEIKPLIKWLNDLYLNGYKIGGILAEGKLIGKEYQFIVLGIGINLLKMAIPDELQTVISTIEQETGKVLNKEELLAKIVNNFYAEYELLVEKDVSFIERYRKYSLLLGKFVYLPNEREPFYVKTINDQGHLIIEKTGKLEVLQAGEVSLHGFTLKNE